MSQEEKDAVLAMVADAQIVEDVLLKQGLMFGQHAVQGHPECGVDAAASLVVEIGEMLENFSDCGMVQMSILVALLVPRLNELKETMEEDIL